MIRRLSNAELPSRRQVTLLGLLVGLIAWAHWNSLQLIADHWTDPRYSHGWLIPLFAVGILWSRRKPMDGPTQGAAATGLALVVAAAVARHWATYY